MDVFDDQFPSWEGQGVGSSMKKLHMTFMIFVNKKPLDKESHSCCHTIKYPDKIFFMTQDTWAQLFHRRTHPGKL